MLSLGISAAGGFLGAHGKPDLRGAYGLHARELLLALHHLQSARGLNVILIGALETVTDDYGRTEHRLQAEGQRVPREIAGIVDIVVTMHWLEFRRRQAGAARLRLHFAQPVGLPGERSQSGKLEQLEPPDLGALIAKVLPPRANHGAAAAGAAVDPRHHRSTSQQAKEKTHDT